MTTATLNKQARRRTMRIKRKRRPLEENLARAITSRREELGLQKVALAKRLGCTRQYIQEVESGKPSFSVATVRKFAEALELTERELYTRAFKL